MNKFIVVFIVFFSGWAAIADDYEISPEYLQTSDNFFYSRLNIDYSGFRSDTWWPYVNEPENGAGWTAHASILQGDTPQKNISSYAVQLGIHNKRSLRNSWTLRMGVTQIKEPSRDEYLDATFYLQSKGSWTNTSWYNLEVSKEYVFMERLILSGAQEQLRSYNLKPSFLYNGLKRQRLFFRGHYSLMDHDNTRTESDLQWMYGLSTFKPWFWVGVGTNFLSFSKQSTNYWSPKEFVSYGPRSEIAYGYGMFQLAAGFNYSRHKEMGFDEGDGFYSNLSLQYGRRESNHLRLTLTSMESSQGNSIWKASSILLNSLIQF